MSSSASLSSLSSSNLSVIFGVDDKDNRRAATYSQFFDSLQYVAIETLGPNEYCPICRDPYPQNQESSQSQTGGQGQLQLPQEPEYHLSLLDSLPFSQRPATTRPDLPVRLPCKFGHIVGDACIRKWLDPDTNGSVKTCPLDREVLFHIPSNNSRRIDPRRRFKEGRHRIESLTLRQLIKGTVVDFDDADARVTVNARYMTSHLAELMWRVALRLESRRYRAPEPVGSVRPPITMRKFMRLGQEVALFQRALLKFAKGVPLDRDGRYPAYLTFLLQDEVAHVYCMLHRMARYQQGTSAHPRVMYMLFLFRIGGYFETIFPGTIVPSNAASHLNSAAASTSTWHCTLEKPGGCRNGGREHRLFLFANHLVAAWVSQAYLMTKLRDHTGTMDEVEEYDDHRYYYLNWEMVVRGYEDMDVHDREYYRLLLNEGESGELDQEGDTQMMESETESDDSREEEARMSEIGWESDSSGSDMEE